MRDSLRYCRTAYYVHATTEKRKWPASAQWSPPPPPLFIALQSRKCHYPQWSPHRAPAKQRVLYAAEGGGASECLRRATDRFALPPLARRRAWREYRGARAHFRSGAGPTRSVRRAGYPGYPVGKSDSTTARPTPVESSEFLRRRGRHHAALAKVLGGARNSPPAARLLGRGTS